MRYLVWVLNFGREFGEGGVEVGVDIFLVVFNLCYYLWGYVLLFGFENFGVIDVNFVFVGVLRFYYVVIIKIDVVVFNID